MRRWIPRSSLHRASASLLRRRPTRLLALTALVAVLAACGPSYRFTASAADDLVVKVPRSWSLVNSGVPANSDGTPGAAGSWFAVYDAAPKPSAAHIQAPHATAPVALLRTFVITKDQGQALTDDELRDLLMPVTATDRSTAAAQGFIGTHFQLISDTKVTSRTASGVHVVFSYDLGQGVEVFDQIVLTDRSKTRVHLLFLHCSQSCYAVNRQAITDSTQSFTVRAT
jgi:hypothetical protein